MVKRKHIFVVLIGIGVMLLLVLLAGVAVLRSDAFHRYALAKIMEKASEATGDRVEIGSFEFRLSGLRVDFRRIVVRGTESAASPPLLQIDHVGVGLKIISLLRRKVDLSEIIVDSPQISATVDNSGHTNWRTAPNDNTAGSATSVFDLAIGHFVVNHGLLNYNDRSIPLDAELHDLNAQIDFSSLKTEYHGSLGYRDGRLQFGTYNPVQHSINAQFAATPSELTLNSLKLSAGSSTIQAQGHLKDYRNPTVDASFQGDVAAAELGSILKVRPFPAGQVTLQGTGQYVNHADRAFIDNLTLAGDFASQAVAINTPQIRAKLTEIRGNYRLRSGLLEAKVDRSAAFGGTVAGQLTIADITQSASAKISATAQHVSLAAVSGALDSSQLKQVKLAGKLDGTMTASWQGPGNNFLLKSDSTITGAAPLQVPGQPVGAAGPIIRKMTAQTARQARAQRLGRAQADASAQVPVILSEKPPPSAPTLQRGASAPDEATAIPLQGEIHLTYDGRGGTMSLANTEFTTPHSALTLNGSTGKQSSLAIQAHSDDLREADQIALIVRHLGATKPSQPPIELLGIAGSATFNGQLRGAVKDLHLTGQMASTNFQYQGTTLSELRANLALSPSEITLSQGEIQTPERASVQFTLGSSLKDWAYTPQSQVRVELNASRVPAATIERLAKLSYPVSGLLTAHISMHGTQTNLTGQGSATLADAVVWKQPVQNLSAQFHGQESTITSTLQVQTTAGSGSGKLTYDFRNQGYDAQFSSPNLQLDKLEALNEGKLQMSGTVSASVQGRGTVKDPQLTASLQTAKLVVARQTLEAVKLQAEVKQHKATLNLTTANNAAAIEARAEVDLDGDYNATAKLDVRNILLGALLSTYLPDAPTGLQGHGELHASLHGPLKNRSAIEAEANIPTLNLSYQTLEIGNTAPLHVVYRRGVVTLDPCALKGTGTDLHLQATVPLDRTQTIQAKATGNIDVHLLQLLYPDWSTSGQVALDLNAAGSIAQPNVEGTVRLTNASLQAPGTPVGVQNLNAALTLKNGRMDIQNLAGEAGGGTVTAQGFATFQPSVQFNLRMLANSVRLRYPVGTRAILDARLTLAGTRASSQLGGRVTIDRLSLTKEFDISTFADQFIGSSGASGGSDFTNNMKLNVSVNSASNMAVASSKLSVQGSANLMVRGTAAEPVILGRTDITDGEIFFNGQRYKVESGVVQFVNPVETEPIVNLHVTTTVNQFDISMNFAGPVDRMRVTYTSDPPLAPVDIINLLATGKTTEAASANSTTPQSVIAGQLTSQFSNRVEKLAGISSLSIDPQVGGSSGGAGAKLTVQQRVTKNLFFSISADLQNSADQTVQIEYQATKRFAVSTTRDQNGGYTIQIKMHHRF